MDITICQALLPHDEPDASLASHRDTLGFEVRNDVEYQGMHWITVGPTEQPGTSIVLYPPAATPGITEDERRTIAEMMAKGTYASINLAPSDLDGTFERLQASEAAEVVQEPTDQPYATTWRGVEFLMGFYPILDRAPKGRDEGDAFQTWIRRHDEYV